MQHHKNISNVLSKQLSHQIHSFIYIIKLHFIFLYTYKYNISCTSGDISNETYGSVAFRSYIIESFCENYNKQNKCNEIILVQAGLDAETSYCGDIYNHSENGSLILFGSLIHVREIDYKNIKYGNILSLVRGQYYSPGTLGIKYIK